MRIVAGTLKGRRLTAPTFAGLRPTSAKLRETLFNVVAPRVSGVSVLDAFAGTGALGLEALSRGARQITFVEQERRAVELIRENVRRCQAEGRCVIIRGRFTELPSRPPTAPFDLILLDPPYDLTGRTGRERLRRGDALEDALETAAAVLTPSGLIVLEHARRRAAPVEVAGLARTRALVSGDSVLTLYEWVGDAGR